MSSARLFRFVRHPALLPALPRVAARQSGAVPAATVPAATVLAVTVSATAVLTAAVLTAAVLTIAALTAATPALADCTCRARGQDYALGTTICLPAGLMRCEMATNVTSWTALGRACPESRMSVPFLVAAADPEEDGGHGTEDGHETEDRTEFGIDAH